MLRSIEDWLLQVPAPAVWVLAGLGTATALVLAALSLKLARTARARRELARRLAELERDRNRLRTAGNAARGELGRLHNMLASADIRLLFAGPEPSKETREVPASVPRESDRLPSPVLKRAGALLSTLASQGSFTRSVEAVPGDGERFFYLVPCEDGEKPAVTVIDVSWVLQQLRPAPSPDIQNRDQLVKLGRMGLARIRSNGVLVHAEGLLRRADPSRITMSLHDVIIPKHRNRVLREMETAMKRQDTRRTHAAVKVAEEGSCWCYIEFRPSRVAGELYIVARDATEARTAQDQKKQLREKLNSLRRQLERGEAELRSRIWAELHDVKGWAPRCLDEVGRTLAEQGENGLAEKVARIRESLVGLEAKAKDSISVAPSTAAAAINLAVQQNRFIARGPEDIDAPAFLDTDFVAVPGLDTGQLHIFAAEVIRNALRHARPPGEVAAVVRVSLRKSNAPRESVILIEDNGTACDIHAVDRSLRRDGVWPSDEAIQPTVSTTENGGCRVEIRLLADP